MSLIDAVRHRLYVPHGGEAYYDEAIGFATLACLAPALRAGRIDPVTALRAD